MDNTDKLNSGHRVITAVQLFMHRYKDKLNYPYKNPGDFLVNTSHGIEIVNDIVCASAESTISHMSGSKTVIKYVQDRLLFHTYFYEHLNQTYGFNFEPVKDQKLLDIEIFDKSLLPESGEYRFSQKFEDRIEKLSNIINKHGRVKISEAQHQKYRDHVLSLLS